MTSGPLSLEQLAGLPCQSFLEHSRNMAEPTLLKSLDLKEKWLEIHGFTNFSATQFVVKCHMVITSEKSQLFRLYLKQYSFGHYKPFMTIDVDRNQQRI